MNWRWLGKCISTLKGNSISSIHSFPFLVSNYGIMGCWFFKQGYKLERFLPKNQHTQRKLWNYENWCSVELSKIGQLWHFLTPPHSPHYTNSQNSIVFFGYVESYAEIFLICTPCLKTRQPVLPYFTFIIHNCSRLKTRLLLIWLNSHQPRTRGHVEHH